MCLSTVNFAGNELLMFATKTNWNDERKTLNLWMNETCGWSMKCCLCCWFLFKFREFCIQTTWSEDEFSTCNSWNLLPGMKQEVGGIPEPKQEERIAGSPPESPRRRRFCCYSSQVAKWKVRNVVQHQSLEKEEELSTTNTLFLEEPRRVWKYFNLFGCSTFWGWSKQGIFLWECK